MIRPVNRMCLLFMTLYLRFAVGYVGTKPALVDEDVAVEPGQMLPQHYRASCLERAHAAKLIWKDHARISTCILVNFRMLVVYCYDLFF